MQDRYVFPALFGYDIPGQVGVWFPDLPGCTSQSDNDVDALRDARDALSALGYSRSEIAAALKYADEGAEADEIIRTALAYLLKN